MHRNSIIAYYRHISKKHKNSSNTLNTCSVLLEKNMRVVWPSAMTQELIFFAGTITYEDLQKK